MIRATFKGDDGSWQLLLPSKTAMGILPGKRPIELSVRLFKSLLSVPNKREATRTKQTKRRRRGRKVLSGRNNKKRGQKPSNIQSVNTNLINIIKLYNVIHYITCKLINLK